MKIGLAELLGPTIQDDSDDEGFDPEDVSKSNSNIFINHHICSITNLSSTFCQKDEEEEEEEIDEDDEEAEGEPPEKRIKTS